MNRVCGDWSDFFKTPKDNGFAAFYAVLIISILLTISLKVLDVALKEQILSSGARDSLAAFYSADSGVECALYNDLRLGEKFASPAPQNDGGTPRANQINCGGVSITLSECTLMPMPGLCSQFTYALPTGGTVDVTVRKKDDNTNDQVRTLVEARGYNMASGDRKVERAIRTEYGDREEAAFPD